MFAVSFWPWLDRGNQGSFPHSEGARKDSWHHHWPELHHCPQRGEWETSTVMCPVSRMDHGAARDHFWPVCICVFPLHLLSFDHVPVLPFITLASFIVCTHKWKTTRKPLWKGLVVACEYWSSPWLGVFTDERKEFLTCRARMNSQKLVQSDVIRSFLTHHQHVI